MGIYRDKNDKNDKRSLALILKESVFYSTTLIPYSDSDISI